MNYKPFNLERALAGDHVITRYGNSVIDLKYWEKLSFLSALIESKDDGSLYLAGYKKEGKFFQFGEESPSDLFMAPKNITKWVNIFKTSFGDGIETYVGQQLFDTEEVADGASL